MTNNWADITLQEMLASKNNTIRRNALSTLKELAREKCEQHIPIVRRGGIRCAVCNKKIEG